MLEGEDREGPHDLPVRLGPLVLLPALVEVGGVFRIAAERRVHVDHEVGTLEGRADHPLAQRHDQGSGGQEAGRRPGQHLAQRLLVAVVDEQRKLQVARQRQMGAEVRQQQFVAHRRRPALQAVLQTGPRRQLQQRPPIGDRTTAPRRVFMPRRNPGGLWRDAPAYVVAVADQRVVDAQFPGAGTDGHQGTGLVPREVAVVHPLAGAVVVELAGVVQRDVGVARPAHDLRERLHRTQRRRQLQTQHQGSHRHPHDEGAHLEPRHAATVGAQPLVAFDRRHRLPFGDGIGVEAQVLPAVARRRCTLQPLAQPYAAADRPPRGRRPPLPAVPGALGPFAQLERGVRHAAHGDIDGDRDQVAALRPLEGMAADLVAHHGDAAGVHRHRMGDAGHPLALALGGAPVHTRLVHAQAMHLAPAVQQQVDRCPAAAAEVHGRVGHPAGLEDVDQVHRVAPGLGQGDTAAAGRQHGDLALQFMVDRVAQAAEGGVVLVPVQHQVDVAAVELAHHLPGVAQDQEGLERGQALGDRGLGNRQRVVVQQRDARHERACPGRIAQVEHLGLQARHLLRVDVTGGQPLAMVAVQVDQHHGLRVVAAQQRQRPQRLALSPARDGGAPLAGVQPGGQRQPLQPAQRPGAPAVLQVRRHRRRHLHRLRTEQRGEVRRERAQAQVAERPAVVVAGHAAQLHLVADGPAQLVKLPPGRRHHEQAAMVDQVTGADDQLRALPARQRRDVVPYRLVEVRAEMDVRQVQDAKRRRHLAMDGRRMGIVQPAVFMLGHAQLPGAVGRPRSSAGARSRTSAGARRARRPIHADRVRGATTMRHGIAWTPG